MNIPIICSNCEQTHSAAFSDWTLADLLVISKSDPVKLFTICPHCRHAVQATVYADDRTICVMSPAPAISASDVKWSVGYRKH